MRFTYKQGNKYEAPFDPELCQASVSDGDRSVRFHQCQRKATRDGWCYQHHPEADTRRRKEQKENWERKQRLRNLPWTKLEKANNRIRELEAQRDELLADLQEIGKRADLILAALPAPRLTVKQWEDAHGQAGMISAIAKAKGEEER